MSIFECVCVNLSVLRYMYAYTFIYTHLCVFFYECECAYVCVSSGACVCVCTCAFVFVYEVVFVCARICLFYTCTMQRRRTLFLTNRASDRYSEHSKREYHEPHKDSCDWQDWGLILEALPPRGGRSAECPKKDKRRAKTHRTHKSIWINESSGEPQVYLKPVEQTLYSAAVPIKKFR